MTEALPLLIMQRICIYVCMYLYVHLCTYVHKLWVSPGDTGELRIIPSFYHFSLTFLFFYFLINHIIVSFDIHVDA